MIPGGRFGDPEGQEGMASLLAAALRSGGMGVTFATRGGSGP